MIAKLHHDLETRSPVDLRMAGVYVYAEHPDTSILTLCWAMDDGPVKTWYPIIGEPIPAELKEAFLDPEVVLCAHNAEFERILQTTSPMRRQRYLPPEIIQAMGSLERWNCTAARAAFHGLPRGLDNCVRALGLSQKKDLEGYKLMLKCCKPRARGEDAPNGDMTWAWNETPEQIERLGLYCADDVRAERAIDLALPDLPPLEKQIWRMTCRMNDRGIKVDQELLVRMSFFIAEAEKNLNSSLRERTCLLRLGGDDRACASPQSCTTPCGAVPKVSDHMALRKWLIAQGYPDVEEDGVGKEVVQEMLDDDDLPELVRSVLLMRRDGGKSSTAKYRALLHRLNQDSRIRGGHMYCGAAATARFSATGVQTQNLPRGGTIKTLEYAVQDVLDGASVDMISIMHGAPMVVASELLRPTLMAQADCWFARGDYSQIEARILAWLANEEWKLKAYRDFDAGTGPDIYRITAASITSLLDGIRVSPDDVSKEHRQVRGKVPELAFGYAGGVGAVQKAGRKAGIHITDAQGEQLKNAWRERNARIENFWHATEDAALNCMRDAPGIRYTVRPGMWFVRNARVLTLRMPSGRSILYWYPKLETIMMPWGKERESVTFWSEDSSAGKKVWSKQVGYGGFFVQNEAQAIARDVMALALLRLEKAGLPPVLTVHDEGGVEAPKARYPERKDAAEAVRSIMAEIPDFLIGCPLAVEASAAQRYVKAA